MTKNYFEGISNLEELKKAYHILAKKYHPDVSEEKNSTQIMQQINKQYRLLFEQLKKGDKFTQNEDANTFTTIINELIKHNNITIDIVGTWIWAYGKGTFSIKSKLKEFNFRWSRTRKKWYFFEGIEKSKRVRSRGGTYEQVINRHGFQRIETKKEDNKKDTAKNKPLLTT